MTNETVWDVIAPDCTGIYRLNGNYDCLVFPGELIGVLPAETYYYFPPLLSFGDYDRSTEIERSNVRVFEKLYKDTPGWQTRTYPHSAKAICIDLTCQDKDIIETLEMLMDYPVLDDKDRAAMEMEMEQEAWASYLERAFIQTIERKFGAAHSNPQEGAVLELFYRLKEQTNTEVLITAGGEVSVDMERLIAQLDEAPPSLGLERWNSVF